MPIVLQNSTVTGNTAIGQDSNLLDFTKVMLKTNPAAYSDADDSFAFQTSRGDAGDASADTSGWQAGSFLVTFDRPVDPSEPGFDTQGRLLIGTDGGIWSGENDDLLIGGRTTFDFHTDGNDFVLWRKSGPLDTNARTFGDQFRGGITVAVGDMEASNIPAGTQLASVTDLVIDPFNSDAGHWEMHDLLLANQDHVDGGRFVYLYYTTTSSAPDGDFDGGLLSIIDREASIDRTDDAPTEEISFAFGDLKVGYLGNGTSSADTGHAGGGGHGAGKAVFSDMSFSASVTNQDAPVSLDAYSPTFLGGVDVPASANSDGSVRTIPPATDAAGVTEYESGLVYSGESGGMGASPTGHYTQMVWGDSDAGASPGRQAMLKMFTADYVGGGESLADAGAADAAAAGGFGTWGLDRIDQRPPAPDDGSTRLGVADTFDFFAYDASFRGGVSVAVGDVDGAGVGTLAATLGDGSVRMVFRSGTGEPAWSHGGDDLLIGGTTAFGGAPGNLQIAALTGFDLL